MISIQASAFCNLAIEYGTHDNGEQEHASIEFSCPCPLPTDELVCLPIAVSEFSLADLVGRPRLLARIEDGQGHTEFRYGLSGSLQPHRSLS